MTPRQRDRVRLAAYILDRADQYKTSSPCWVALSDVAENIANGTADDRIDAGEVDDLIERVKTLVDTSRG